ncbi:MAG TPA: tetratricopeptide repeat protein [Roseiflexaceae bacterium]|nr:tetratricopeptide repeat protein [Roseiflexaceae bacterium]
MLDTTGSLKQRLSTLRQTVRYLLDHAAAVGGEVFLPPDRRHSLDQARRDIAACKADLRAYGVLVDDQPDDVVSPTVAPGAQHKPEPQPPSVPQVAAANTDSAGNQGAQGVFQGPVTIHQVPPPVPNPSAAPAPQLRPPTRDFVGRDDVVAEIVMALQPDTASSGAVISGVRGMGGIGKTELALAVATRLRDTYADGHILLDLLGSSDAPLDPVQALQRVIQVFRPEDKLPDDLPALEALYHTTLSGRRVLILADDAHTPGQVRPLTPPLGCALLITTRLRFVLDGMTSFDLEALPIDAAVALLRRICPRLAEDQARRIATLCGRLPLALRISGGMLLNDPALSVERYLRDLENERTRLAQLKDPDDPARDVEAVLRVSYAKLDGQSQAIFRRLGVIGADADLALLSDVLVVPEQQLDKLLRALLRRYLVEYDQKTRRWGMHALVRVYALGQLAAAGADKERAARMRYAKRVIAIINFANQRYRAGRNGVLEGLSRFDQERAHLEAVRAWLWAQIPVTDIDVLVMTETDATAYLGDLRDPLRAVRVPQLERAIVAAQRRRDRKAEATFLGNLGNVYSDLGEVRRAIELYEQRLTIARELGDRRGEGSALGNLGIAYYSLGEVQRAIDLHEQALAIARERGDRASESSALGNLGNVYADLGEVQRAIELYEQALAIARERGDRRGEGRSLGNLGRAYSDLGEVRRAIELYEQDLAIARELGDRASEGSALGNLGKAYSDLGEVRRAIELYEQCLTIVRERDDRRGEGRSLGNLGRAYSDLGEMHQAIKLYEQALVIVRELDDQHDEGIVLGNLGVVYADLADLAQTLRHADEALHLLHKAGDRSNESYVLNQLGRAHLLQGELDESVAQSTVALTLARDTGNRQVEGMSLRTLAKAYAALGQLTEADANFATSLAVLETIENLPELNRTRWDYGHFLIQQGERERGLTLLDACVAYEQRIGHAKAAEHAAEVDQLRQERTP